MAEHITREPITDQSEAITDQSEAMTDQPAAMTDRPEAMTYQSEADRNLKEEERQAGLKYLQNERKARYHSIPWQLQELEKLRKHGGPYKQFYQVYPVTPSSELFITDLWFQIVDQINASSDLLRTRYEGKAWYKEFVKDLDWTIPQSPTVFEAARSEIEKSHDEFIIMLEGLAREFYIQEVAYSLLTRIASSWT